MLRNFRNHLGKGRFGRNVFTVMSGTVAAQMISILFAPLLTRIIPPEEFGKFALFTSINLIFLATVCGQYENAIQLPQKNEDAEKILQGALRIALLASSLVALAVVIAFMAGWGPFTQNAFLLLPITLILGGLQQVLIQWVNRQKIFRLTSAARVTQALTNSGLNLFLGWLGNERSLRKLGDFKCDQLLDYVAILKRNAHLFQKGIKADFKNLPTLSSLYTSL